jgi:hypothetical protein
MSSTYGFEDVFLGMGIFFLVFFTIMFLVWATVLTLHVVGQWKMFTKAKEEGWKALIPIYNFVVLSNLVGITPWWLLIIGICYLVMFIPFINIIIWIPLMVLWYYYLIILAISTARSYGKSDAWAVGFVLVPWLFYFLVGINKDDKYLGPKPINDPVWDWLKTTFGGEDNNVKEAKVPEINMVKCPKCDAEVVEGTKFCPNCGKKMEGKK